jgi:hypothetical protein
VTRLGRYALYALALAAALGWGAAWWAGRQATRLEESEALRQLVERGGVQGRVKRPKPQMDVPRGAVPIASGGGRLDFRVDRRNVPGTVSPGAAPGPASSDRSANLQPDPTPEPGAWPSADDLAGGCRFDIVRAGRTPVLYLWWDGRLQGAQGGVVASRGPELVPARRRGAQGEHTGQPGADLGAWLDVAPQAVEPADRFAVGLRRPRAWRVGWFAGPAVYGDPIRGEYGAAVVAGYGVQF